MAEQRCDPIWLGDLESPPEDPSSRRRLCIISGDALLSREFIAALQTAVGPNQEIKIVLDRRRGGPGTAPGQPPVDRRRLPQIDALVKMDGYAIVPLRTSSRGIDPPGNPRPPRVQDPMFAVRAIERRPAERSFFERRSLGDETDADERELERILDFKRRHKVRLGPTLVLTALVGVLAILLVQRPVLETLMSRIPWQATPPAERTSQPLQPTPAPRTAETPSPPRQSDASPPPGRAENPERLSEANSTPRAETVPVPRPQRDAVAGVRPAPPRRVSSPPIAGVRAPQTLRGESRFPGIPRVELARSSLPTAEGKADSYLVRMSDPVGRPLTGAEVLLFASMADGTVENITLGAGPEPGTYAGTSRPSRSVPVDFRIRLTTSDKRFEIPLSP